MARPRVVFWNSQPTPYMVGRWNAIARRDNLDLLAWFNVRREPDRSWNVHEEDWLFQGRYLPQRTIGGRSLYLTADALRIDQPDLIVQAYNSASFVAGLCAGRAAGSRVTLRTLPTYDTWVPRRRAKELMKHAVFRAVDGVKTGSHDGRKMVRRYGIPDDRVFNVLQSIDVDHFARARDIPAAERCSARMALGLTGCVFLYVGRLWSKKGLDDLFDAYRQVRAAMADVSLLLVGDGVDEARYRAHAADLPGVVFAGFVQPDDLPSMYALADVFVFPTLGDPHGLVVEEAMVAGLPVICTEAAGDIRARLMDGKAGIVVPPANADTLAAAMLRLARDPHLRTCLAESGACAVAHRTHEAYARDFEHFVETVLAMPQRRTPAALAAGIVGKGLTRIESRWGHPHE